MNIEVRISLLCWVFLILNGISRSNCLAQETSASSSLNPLIPLKIHQSGRWMVKEDDTPFFWLGDTAWKLFANLDSSEANKYLTDRMEKGFTVIQAHILPWHLSEENAYGERPFVDQDLKQPNEAYWKHVDFIIQRATQKGLYMAILPMWARTYIETVRGNAEDKLFLADSTHLPYEYGYFLGERYRAYPHLIWILGGDEWGTKDRVYDQMAKGIMEGRGQTSFDQVLMSYHPQGGTYRPPATSTSEFYHEKAWMDFNMIQSGHSIGNRNFERITADYQLEPIKPTIDSEPCYEQHPVRHKFELGTFDAWHLRRRGYWSVLAGAFGFTYGGNGIWQMAKPGRNDQNKFNYYWYEAIDFEGGKDMRHLRSLFESRPFVQPQRVPDQRIVVRQEEEVDFHIQAARAEDYSYWIVYFTSGQEADLHLMSEGTKTYLAWWYNPRNGRVYTSFGEPTEKPFAEFTANQVIHLDPPGEAEADNDWILLLDDPDKAYSIPSLSQ